MHQFDHDIAVSAGGDACQAQVTPRWSVNENPDGGYLMAMAANALLEKSEKKWPAIITANFIVRCQPAAVRIVPVHMGRSRTFDRWQAVLTQEDSEKIRVLGTFIDRTEDAGDKRYELAPPSIPPPEECVGFPQLPGYTIFDQMDVRLDPACAGWFTGASLAERSEHKGWIRFREERDFDPLGIILAADAFPPAVLASQGMVAWVPTIEMTVNVRNCPQSPWLKGLFRSSFINNGLAEEDGQLWDETGELIAISRQITLFRKIGS